MHQEDFQDTFSELVAQAADRFEHTALALRSGIDQVGRIHQPVEAILELLVDLGMILRQFEIILPERKNPEVFEDPMDRSDDLGNVRMIHRTPRAFPIFSPIVSEFGERVGSGAARVLQFLHRNILEQQVHEDIDYFLDDWDLAYTSDPGLAAKKRILGLTNSLVREFREKRLLKRRLAKSEAQIEQKKELIRSLHDRLRALSKEQSSSKT